MANEEQIAILKKHGAEAWNAWRTQHPDVRPDLSRADLFRTILIEAHLEKANLIEATDRP
jgi:hypothetical protein